MIPGFSVHGLLPPGPLDAGYLATVEEVEANFVGALGSPEWRVALFEGWRSVSAAVWEDVPGARWWLWGCFVSNHPIPLHGQHESLTSLVILPEGEVAALGWHRQAKLRTFLQAAEGNHRVDVSVVYEFLPGDERVVDTMELLEYKYRPRASRGVADHSTGTLVAAGFVEVMR